MTPAKAYDVAMIDQNTGWIVGDSGLIFHTTNGGTIWTEQTTTVGSALPAVDFINDQTGWVAGHFILLHTTTGGS